MSPIIKQNSPKTVCIGPGPLLQSTKSTVLFYSDQLQGFWVAKPPIKVQINAKTSLHRTLKREKDLEILPIFFTLLGKLETKSNQIYVMLYLERQQTSK